jgi:hypothetical protein
MLIEVYYVYKESTIDSFSTLEMRVENKEMFVSTEKLPFFTATLTGWDRSSLPNTITITSRKLRKKTKTNKNRLAAYLYDIYQEIHTNSKLYLLSPFNMCS